MSDSYFSKRAMLADQTKKMNLADKAAEKQDILDAGLARDRVEVLHAREQAAESMVGRLGLDTDSVPGRAVNLMANVFSGTARAVGDAAVIAPSLMTAATELGMQESDFQAYNRYVKGEATPQDIALLNSTTKPSDVPGIVNATRLEMFNKAKSARESAIGIDKQFDQSSAVDQRFKNALINDLGADFEQSWNSVKQGWNQLTGGEKVDGAGNLLSGLASLGGNVVDAAVNNPQGVMEYVAENTPQLLVGAVRKGGAQALLATNAGYGADYYHKGIAKYQAENGGAYPPEAMRKEMAKAAGLAGSMEQISDKVSLGFGKLANAAGKVSNRAVKTIGATAGGMTNEAITEGIQTYLEGEASLEPASAQDIFTGAAIGGLTGGVLTGGLRAVNEAGAALAERAEKNTPVTETPEYKETFKQAVETNNPDVFLDKESNNYNPVAAVGVLFQAAQAESATPEIKAENLAKATEIIESLEQERESLVSGNSEAAATTQAEIAKIDQLMEVTDPADTQKIAALESMKAEFEKDLQQDMGDPEVNAPKIAQLDKALTLARQVQTELGSMVSPVTPEEFQNLVASVKSTEKGVATKAADNLINLSMTAPDSVDVKALSAIVADKANGLKPEQRNLLRQFTEARKRENSLMTISKVSQTILIGDPAKRQMGIAQYRKEIGTALKAGNQKAAMRPLSLMDKFVASHKQKAALTAQALSEGAVRQVVRLENGQWEIRDPNLEPLTQKQMTDSGSVTVMPNVPKSVELVGNIQKEAAILENSYNQLASMVQQKFAGVPKKAGVLSINVLEEEQGKPRPDILSEPKDGKTTPNSIKENKSEPITQEVQSNTTKDEVALDTSTSKPSGQSVANAPSASASPTTNQNKEVEQTNTEQQDEAQAKSPVAQVESATTNEEQQATTNEYSGLKVFKSKVSKLVGSMQDNFLKTNLVAQFLDQKQTNEKYKSARPLVSMEDFITQWNNTELKPEEFLAKFIEAGQQLDDEQVFALNHMRKFITDMLPEFTKDLVEYTGDSAFKSRDPMQYMMENGDIEENIKAAMGYSMYSYILSQANNPAYLTKEQVNEMHSKDGDTEMTDAAYGELSQYSAFEQTIIDELGTVAVQSLGLIPNDNAPINLLPNLVTAMGIRVLAAMERAGYIERISRNAREIEILLDPANEAAAKAKFTEKAEFKYIKFVREADGKTLTESVRELRDANGGTRGVVDKLFGSEKAPRIARTVPTKFTQQFAKGTDRAISKAQREVVQETMDTPHTTIPAMMQLFQKIGRQAVLKAAGWTDINEKNVHAVNKLSVEAQNQNLENQYDQMTEMLLNQPEDQEYFVEQSVWRNFRAGFMNQSLNQQTSKIHRFAFQRPGWEVEIDLNNQDQVNEYKVSVAMMLGVKTDGQLNEKTLKQFDSWLNEKNPNIVQAINLISDALFQDRDLTPAESDLVAEAAASAEGMASLQAMTSYAHYLNAKPGTKFKTTLLVGVDGKTNGPILSHLALGAAADLDGFFVLLNRGGMFSTDENQPTHYSQYAAQGNMDLYQDLGLQIVHAMHDRIRTPEELTAMVKKKDWKNLYSHFTVEDLNALQVITGNLLTEDGSGVTSAGRNLTKTPLTSFAFGSSVNKSINNMENKFIESIYENIEKISVGNPKAPTRIELIQAINQMIRAGSGKEFLSENMTIEQMMEANVLTGKEQALRKGFQRIVKVPVNNTMNTYFAVFINRRKSLVNTVQASYSAYASAYEAVRNAEITRLMNEGEIAYRMSQGEMKPLHDLSVKQERALREKITKMLPIMHTDYSIRENNLDAGIYMAKSERKTSTAPLYSGKVELGAPLKGRKSKAVEAPAIVRMEASPGVAGASYPIHSSDSAIMHKTLAKVKNSLNVHDEISNSVDNVTTAARTMNEMTADTFLNYSPAQEAVNMLNRIVSNMVNGVKDGSIHPSAVRNMLEQWVETYSKGVPAEEAPTIDEVAELVIRDAVGNAYRADSLRLEAFTKMGHIDQYVWEGGQFEVTQTMRDAAAAKLKNLQEEPSAEMLEMIDFLNKTYKEEELGISSVEGSTVDLTIDREADEDLKDIHDYLVGLPGTLAVRAVMMIADKYLVVADQVSKGIPVMKALESLEPFQRAGLLASLARMGKDKAGNASPWGQLGESSGHNANLLAMFNGKDSVTLKELAPVLFQELKTSGTMTEVYNLLLKQAIRTVDENLKIVMVRPDTPADAILDKGASNARGWYVSKNGDQAIYILSPDFANSKVAPELLLHELVHSALARTIETELKNPTDTPVGQHVKNLQNLLEEAKVYVKANDIKGFDAALVNVHELVSWGLTNKEFQQEVLNKFKSKVSIKSSNLVTTMKHFIGTITGILFKGSKLGTEDRMKNGLMILVINSAALYSEAAQNKVNTDVVLNQEANPVDEVAGMTTEQLYNSLVNHNGQELDVAHDQHLRGLLNGIVNKLHGPMGSFKAELMRNQDLSGREIMAEALTSGQIPFAAEALDIGGMTEQEAMVLEQVEATVAEALKDGGAQTGIVHRELLNLYEEMRSKLKPEHFHVENATPAEVADAQALHDFLFKVQDSNGKSNYLTRFAALALVNKEVRNAMKIATNTVEAAPADADFLTRMMVWFEKALGLVSAKLTRTFPGQNADEKLSSLVQQLVDSEAKRRRVAIKRNMRNNPADNMMVNASEAVRTKVLKMTESSFFKNNTSKVIQTIGSVSSVIVGDRLAKFGEALNDFRNENFEGRHGVFMGILNEVRGATESSVVFHFLLRAAKRIEGIRKDIMTGTTKLALESFVNKGKNLTQEDKKAISAGVLRTDMGSLLEQFSMEELNVLVQNEKALERAINNYESQLTTKYKHFYIKQSRLLGYHMATGDARGTVYLNAGNIARMYETPYADRVTEAEVKEAEGIIDILASLHAMKHTRTEHKILLRKVFKEEMARTDGGNGLELVMKMHQQLLKESKEKLFNGSEALYMKGYTSEIYNPYNSVVAATAQEGLELELQGWRKGDPVVNDDDAVDQEQRWLYTLRDGGMSRRVSGTISNTGMRMRGSPMHDGNVSLSSSIGRYHAKQMDQVSEAKRKELALMFKADPNFNPAEANPGKQYMLAVFNANGRIANWRYMMKHSTKDRVLERDNRFEQILGTMAGSIYDKQATKVQNREVIKALHEQYKAEYGSKPKAYVAIGPMVADQESREIYNLLPDDTKLAIREMFGKDEMLVRSDLLDINFGYRKLSWADGFNKDSVERDLLEKMMVESMSYVFGKKAQLRVRQGQLWWQTLVQMTKDNMVVKSFSTLAGNFKSNITELLWFGVSPMDIIKHHRVAFRGALDYRRDTAELFDLEAKLKLDYLVGPARKEMEAKVIRLRDAVNRNPIKGMIDAGLMPTIVEDVDMQEDIYSYKSKFVRSTEKVTKHLNPQLVTAGKWVLMTQDTPLYKWMSHGTQLSDFVARYTLYQHLINRKVDPMAENEAIQTASDAFVNYDIPSHRRMQALNDDGFVWFTKYYLRIQKVILKLMRDNPGRTMGMVGLEAYFATMPSLLDSAAVNRIGGNPFSVGALKYPSTIDDTMIIKNLMSAIK